MSKVFLSYSHRDFDFVKALYDRFTKDGIDCFFDRESIAWGSNWVVELERGVEECDVMVVVLSRAYCESEWTRIENTSLRVDDPAALRRKIRPLLLEDCGAVLPWFFKPIQSIDVSTPEKLEREYPKIRRELGGDSGGSVDPEKSSPGGADTVMTTPEMPQSMPGKTKLEFCKRLGGSWPELALILDIPASDQACFIKGREAQHILDWLENRKSLYKLPDALAEIGRKDLVKLLVNPG
ncbi:MAG: TIR domain-containing protein [Methylococcaceae bacterium]|nr:TIR domain-containing protein [Methylococcaceae bacterium]